MSGSPAKYQNTCRICGTKFKTNRKNAAYCGNGCSPERYKVSDEIKRANERWLSKPSNPNGWR